MTDTDQGNNPAPPAPTNAAPAPAQSWWQRAAAWSFALLALLVGGLGYFLIVDRIDMTPATGGSIFVETPQIYTRERLVNDRFIQDSWLRRVLLTEEPEFAPQETIAVTTRQGASVTVRTPGPSGDNAPPAPAAPNETTAAPRQPAMPPPLNFLLRNAYRELIRSHLIENQLDDRHDFRGTTIYMLKFDVSIVPGNNTRKRAFIRVRVVGPGAVEQKDQSPQPEAKPAAGKRPSGAVKPAAPPLARAPVTESQEYFEYFTDHPDEFYRVRQDAEANPVLRDFDLYTQWREGLQDRLNSTLTDIIRRFNSNNFGYREYDRLLSMITEKKGSHAFSNWAVLLSRLRSERDKMLKEGQGGPAIAMRDHRFHQVAKLILAAAAEDRTLDSDEVVQQFAGAAAVTPGDDGKLQMELLNYAVRSAGLSLIGDATFRVEYPQQQTKTRYDAPDIAGSDANDKAQQIRLTRSIRSKMLDDFVDLKLTPQSEPGSVPEIQVVPRFLELFAMDSRETEKIVQEKVCDLVPEADRGFGFANYYSLVGRYEEPAPAGQKGRPMGVFRSVAADLQSSTGQGRIPDYLLTPENLVRAFRNIDSLAMLTKYGDCIKSAKGVGLPVGFFLFADKIRDVQTYTYATLPRLDLLVSETAQDATEANTLGLRAGGAPGSASANVDSYYRRFARAVEPKTAIVGFSGATCPPLCDRDGDRSDELHFGWVFSPPEASKRPGRAVSFQPMHPTQRSLSALVTVPTWWKEARLEVTTGWIGDSGSLAEAGNAVQTHRIPLPIDFEALDAILTLSGRRDSRRPVITLERLPDRIDVQACERAEILIPGYRLWRSSVVVLGDQRADEVTVLPDMRGIIATFNRVGPLGPSDAKSTQRMLQVWTSEGVAGTGAGVVPVTVNGREGPCPPMMDVRRPATAAAGAQ